MATFVKTLVVSSGLVQSGTAAQIDLTADVTGSLPVANGGTGSNDAAGARTNLGLAIGTNVQAYDATLLAFAALSIAANSLTIGAGPDGFSQTSFAPNTFPARASTGDLVAKAITDFGLSLVDDANAGAARTTLGATTVGGNIFTVTNPGAIRFLRVNADNSVTLLSDSDFRTAIGATGLSDGDKGDITVGGSGTTLTIDNDAVTFAKMQNISEARLLGRSNGDGTGDIKEIVMGQAMSLASDVLICGSAGDTQVGVIEIAVQSEMEAATSTTLAVPPGRMKFHPGVCKGWITFDGTGTPAASASYNYTSITDNGTGDWTVNWDVDFSAHTYVALCSATSPGATAAAAFPCLDNTATGSTRVFYGTVDGSGIYQAADRNEVCLAVFGDQ
jgi:hypothetical protein